MMILLLILNAIATIFLVHMIYMLPSPYVTYAIIADIAQILIVTALALVNDDE